MQERGWSAARLRRELRSARAEDLGFSSGQVLGSMCTAPHPAALEADALFAETNLGDPAHFPGAARLEREALADALELIHGPRTASARLVSGGTEANLLACAVAREKTGRSTIVLPETAHFSFEKAARLLRMKLRYVAAPTGRVDPQAMAVACDSDTAVAVAVAGTTELGLVDDVQAIARRLREKGTFLHVDAAFGGYVLPFVARPPAFDFRVPGVSSVALDPHKMGLATIPAGILALRDGRDWHRLAVASPYVSTETQSTLLGTRPGAAAAATWAAQRAMGRAGYRALVASCLGVTRLLGRGLTAAGWPLVAPPQLNVLAFRAANPARVADKLRRAGFSLNVIRRLGALRIVVGPHVTKDVAERFLRVLGRAPGSSAAGPLAKS